MRCVSRAAPAKPRSAYTSKTISAGVVARIDDDLRIDWRGAPPQHVWIAPSAFQRVIANLVNNAQQHGEGARLWGGLRR